MKMISKILIILSLCLSGLIAHAQENQPGTPNDTVATPEAGPRDDSDVKGSIAEPTKEQKKSVKKPTVKKANAKKAHTKKFKKHGAVHTHGVKHKTH